MRYDWLVTVILALHFGYLAYLVLGGFLAWRWPKAFFVHVAACIWGVLIVLSVVDCPLTFAEHWAREKAGQTPTTAGFIDRYLTNVMYPSRVCGSGPAGHRARRPGVLGWCDRPMAPAPNGKGINRRSAGWRHAGN